MYSGTQIQVPSTKHDGLPSQKVTTLKVSRSIFRNETVYIHKIRPGQWLLND